ncbi:hypothetical protein M8C21_018546 [Ambrosia artemisiifolia]|uniref:RPW8 domain-containing protein n=1 Tax=Ambrosia artemisiifolia TaxID=4212 RepID=A0AAD5G6G2_AMBAR|nr:hypothetical protein M8C21_018546 [Ambrosia artemisiifolia]
MFIFHLEQGKELVVKYSRIKFWNVFQKFVYSNKLIRLNNELLWFFKVELHGNMMSTSMRSLIGIYDLSDKLDQVLSAVTTHTHVNRNSCIVPRLPEHVVGFNLHLEELKRRLLNCDTQVLVVSGPGGCGKTTLAKMLCHDNEIKVDELPIVKECFLDLGSFPEDERISATVLMDMWVELYNLDDEGISTSENLLELSLRNLINLASVRKYAGELDGYCNELYVTQHDLLRELAIYLSSQEAVAQRKRMFIDIHKNEFPTWWIAQIEQPINARILSISTDEAFGSIWYDLKAPKVEVLILNIRSTKYTIAEFIKRMNQLKVLIITSYSDYPSQLHNLSLIECLSNLRTIRFDHVVFSTMEPIFALRNLRKLSFVMCEIGNALTSCFTESPYILSSITNLEFDLCYDLKELPSGLYNLIHLQKLSITNCQELEFLPKGLEHLLNLEILRLHCCTKLQELPESIGSLRKLNFLDISDCLSISVLPEEIGELCGLRVLKMDGCSGLQELPVSMSKLLQLEDVICDEETSYMWMEFESVIRNLKINVVEDDRLESFMKIVQ